MGLSRFGTCQRFNGISSKMNNVNKCDVVDKYTSTGVKFWEHKSQMDEYKNGGYNTVISTHISPEGNCNLDCNYCSVANRTLTAHIPFEVIQDYVVKLKTKGLKAVILTGGGEPTLYKQFNQLVQWLKYDSNLSVALITNGTTSRLIEEKTWKSFSWVRVSINIFDNWESKIKLPIEQLDNKCIVGCSFVHTDESQEVLKKISKKADELESKYVRFLPNCTPQNEELLKAHSRLDQILSDFKDSRFFHQFKIHEGPNDHICHQSYFRPYLSEEIYDGNGKPGTVYPCDSVVLNNFKRKFMKQYQICYAMDVLEFIDRRVMAKFDPTVDCKGCVFTKTVNMLGDWKNGKIEKDFLKATEHGEFV